MVAPGLRVRAYTYGTTVNGPGSRNMLHLQGCSIHCKGCFNPETWNPDGELTKIQNVAKQLLIGSPDGVTISGGEPMDQSGSVLELIKEIRSEYDQGISVLMYTGYTQDELKTKGLWEEILTSVDILVCGPFVQELAAPDGEFGLRSSTNQELVLPPRSIHTLEDLSGPMKVEIIIDKDVAHVTGFPTKRGLSLLGIALRGAGR